MILGQLQGMQKALREDQELRVEFYTGTEVIHVLEIFVPTPQVFVLSGTDSTREHGSTGSNRFCVNMLISLSPRETSSSVMK